MLSYIGFNGLERPCHKMHETFHYGEISSILVHLVAQHRVETKSFTALASLIGDTICRAGVKEVQGGLSPPLPTCELLPPQNNMNLACFTRFWGTF